MDMTLRWFGDGFDTVSLENIRQIPGVTGVVSTLYDAQPGDLWEKEKVNQLKNRIESTGLKLLGIESVNIHDSIKVGTKERDQYIENYIKTIEILGEAGVKCICYNFMPVFDWTRSDLAKLRNDGATVLAYDQKEIDQIDPANIFESMQKKAGDSLLPGWEPERMAHLQELFEMYADVDEEKLFENLKYFLEAIQPACEKYEVNMAIHPDDPPWKVFGLPRIMTSKENLLRLTKMVDAPFNGITLCTGSLGSNPDNDIPDMIRSLKGRIHFAHVRNIKHNAPGDFQEAAHLSSDGSLDMYEIMKALADTGFEGLMRPDHGRMIWGEKAMPGYGLYDRALGAAYLNGLWEAIQKNK
ncbi:MAG: mannonate dehydratase [Lachnospiraceae bacterium]|nr:mannonate dehydratase [Lachnospiraceae bacterium]